MIAAIDRFIQFKFLHRAYYTLKRLAHIYRQRDPNCQRCKQEIGLFWHMVWSCPKLQPYWEAVASKLTDITGVNIWVDPSIMLLSHMEDMDGDRYSKLCLTFSLCYARREILLKCKSKDPLPAPPGSARWIRCCPYTE